MVAPNNLNLFNWLITIFYVGVVNFKRIPYMGHKSYATSKFVVFPYISMAMGNSCPFREATYSWDFNKLKNQNFKYVAFNSFIVCSCEYQQ